MKTSESKGRVAMRKGFTLLEIIASMAVLAVIGVLAANFMGGLSTASRRSTEGMDNFARGRTIMNLLERDLQNAVIRPDLPSFPGGEFAFYSASYANESAAANARPLAYVRYSRPPGQAEPSLFRDDVPYQFNVNPAWSSSQGPSQTPVTRILSDGVYAFSWAFIDQSGNASKTFSPANTRAVQVSILVVSEQAEKLLENAGGPEALEAFFKIPDDQPQSGGWSPKVAWDNIVDKHPGMAAFPPQVRSGIQTFERVIPIRTSP